MSKTLVIINPHAANGRAGELWSTIQPMLWDYLGELVVVMTQSPEDVAQQIHQSYKSDLTRVISIGGDGTNHSLINALVAHHEQFPDQTQMEYGVLPVGTGRDWARSRGIPFDIEAAVKWLAEATPQSVDVGQVQFAGKTVYFLNVASVGISGDVVTRVEKSKRRPWSFLSATVRSLVDFHPPSVQIRLDGNDWYEGRSYLVAVANGTTFGRGMKIAPLANISDGLFDVVLVEGMSRLRAIDALRRVYDGKHLDVKHIRHAQAKSVEIVSQATLGMELDGEYAAGQTLRFDIKHDVLNLLS